MIHRITNTEKVKHIFGDWQETVIWSCLQQVMGSIYADDPKYPMAAMAVLGDFCYFAGTPKRELVQYKPVDTQQDFIIMVPSNDEWGSLIETCYGERSRKVMRYAIRKGGEDFKQEKLEQIVASLDSAYSLQLIDENIYNYCLANAWSKDFVANYSDYQKYAKLGLGVAILKDGEPVSGASSYSSYRGGIEIEIGTKEAYRRQGLAYACGAGLILECLKRNLYPSWDAQNKWSVGLAEKLGYHYEHDYPAYEITDY